MAAGTQPPVVSLQFNSCVAAACLHAMPPADFTCCWCRLPLPVAVHLAVLTGLRSHCSRLVLGL